MTQTYLLDTPKRIAEAIRAIETFGPMGAYMILVMPNDPEKLRLVPPVQPVDYEMAAA